MAIKQMWRVGERQLKNNVERRMMIFGSLVKDLTLYAAEI
jgi:hypothetical protein